MSNSLRLRARYRVCGENQAKAVVRPDVMRPRRLGSDRQRELLKAPLNRYVGPHQFIPKAEQHQDLQGRQGCWELGRMKLGGIEPFLHGEGLRCPISLQ